MARREPCVGFQAYNLTLEGALYDYFSRGFAAYDLKIPSTPSALEAQANDFCMDPSFTAFLKAEGYQIHICEEFRTQQRDAEMCMAFHTYLPAPFEVSSRFSTILFRILICSCYKIVSVMKIIFSDNRFITFDFYRTTKYLISKSSWELLLYRIFCTMRLVETLPFFCPQECWYIAFYLPNISIRI